MLMSLSKIIISFILNDACDEKQREICEYGCELWLYTILSTLGLFMIGLFAKAPIEAIVIISIFYVCQSIGGGFHASTHIKCFFTMVCGLSMGILAIRLFNIHSIFYRFWFVPFIVLFVFPLCLHRNKQHLQCQSQQLIKKSRLATAALFFICIVLRFLNYDTLYKASYLGFCLSAVSRICGLLMQNAHKIKIVKN